jgi:hypothetical protein
MTARAWFPALLIALAGFALNAAVAADDEPDCTRYRIAGLPCPSRPGAARSPETAHLPLRPVLPPRATQAPPSVAPGQLRDASGALGVSGTSAPARASAAPAPAVPSLLPLPSLPLAVPAAGLSSLPVLPAGSALMPMAIPPPPPLAAAPPRPAAENREPGQVVVYWASADEADAALATLARERQIQPATRSRLEALGGVLAVFQLATPALAADFREQLARDFPGLAADFNTRYRPLQQPQARPRIYLPQKIDALPARSQSGRHRRRARWHRRRPGGGDRGAAAGRASRAKVFWAATDIAAAPGHATAIAALISGQDACRRFHRALRRARLHSAEIMRAVGAGRLRPTARPWCAHSTGCWAKSPAHQFQPGRAG